ncbi:MAG TPA: cytochrome c [Thermoanaerobaculia bacterium]
MSPNRTLLGLALTGCLLASAGCRQNMHNQPKIEPYETSTFFDDGQGARPIPANTVARGDLREGFAYTGLDAANKPVAEMPFPATREVLVRGQERFNVFCSPCHGRMGDGRGMIVRRGYKQPTSFHDPRLQGSAVGYFFSVMTDGFGVMPSYAPQIPVKDRWAIAAYIRALQYSQNARLADLPPDVRQRVQTDLAGGADAAAPAPHGSQGVQSPAPLPEADSRPE